eukprot:CAMPEP_0180437786 /NCGR_PEP_ID=MMETSP1036_2-20121128/11729_1 /TAXON_ID=632150 /ORGANISM="Azadinium spinosum, Strain 3D9" /LENGTH=51 /DNA_ID=CAMNT_0022443859 /DNA_START=30 /DNA_END=182 /DNA_ORIENTATION=-
MHAEDLLVNNCTHWHAIKHVAELFPQLDVVSPLAFIIKTVDPGDGGTFMIA